MLRNKAFLNNTDKYDDWFDRNTGAYKSEVKAFSMLNIGGKAVEIGAGTGKFAEPLGIKLGVEPTGRMYEKALALGIDIVEGVAEALPLRSSYFDWAVMVTTICFVNDPSKSMSEAFRILKSGGGCAIGLVDKDTVLGRKYLEKKDSSDFYREAVFYSSEDVISCLTRAGFTRIGAYQTLTGKDINAVEEPLEGYGRGGFAVIYGFKP